MKYGKLYNKVEQKFHIPDYLFTRKCWLFSVQICTLRTGRQGFALSFSQSARKCLCSRQGWKGKLIDVFCEEKEKKNYSLSPASILFVISSKKFNLFPGSPFNVKRSGTKDFHS